MSVQSLATVLLRVRGLKFPRASRSPPLWIRIVDELSQLGGTLDRLRHLQYSLLAAAIKHAQAREMTGSIQTKAFTSKHAQKED